MKLLVTGGAGFIGSNFIRHILSRRGFHVVNFDLLTYAGNLQNLAGLGAGDDYRFIRGDISSRRQVAGAEGGDRSDVGDAADGQRQRMGEVMQEGAAVDIAGSGDFEHALANVGSVQAAEAGLPECAAGEPGAAAEVKHRLPDIRNQLCQRFRAAQRGGIALARHFLVVGFGPVVIEAPGFLCVLQTVHSVQKSVWQWFFLRVARIRAGLPIGAYFPRNGNFAVRGVRAGA